MDFIILRMKNLVLNMLLFLHSQIPQDGSLPEIFCDFPRPFLCIISSRFQVQISLGVVFRIDKQLKVCKFYLTFEGKHEIPLENRFIILDLKPF